MKLTESTLIPISLVVTLLGGVFWLSAMWSQVQAASEDIAEVTQKQEVLSDKLIEQNQQIIERLARIEARLGINN